MMAKSCLLREIADRDDSGRYPDADFDSGRSGQFGNRIGEHQRRVYCALNIGLVSARIAKVREGTVAHVLGNIPLEARDNFGNTLPISDDQFTQVFRIELGRNYRRTFNVAEED